MLPLGACVTHEIIQRSSRQGCARHKQTSMFRAIGVIMILWYLSHLFGNSFQSLDKALTATFETLEATLVASREGIH